MSAIADEVETMVWAFPAGDSRREDVRALAKRIREHLLTLERQRSALLERAIRAETKLEEAADASPEKCPRCLGCGQIANSDDGEAWTHWAELPPGSDIAVRMGIVRPIPCPECSTPPNHPQKGSE